MKINCNTNNMVTLEGRIVKVREFGKNVATIVLAVDGKKSSKLFHAKCFVPACYKTLKPGLSVRINGHISQNKYEKDGIMHYSTDIVCDFITFLETRKALEARSEAKSKLEAVNG